MSPKNNLFNTWTIEDEKSHPSSSIEWWCAETFFTTIENNKNWSLKAVITQWPKEKKSKCNITIFDKNSDKQYICLSYNPTQNLCSDKNGFNIKYENSYIKGAFPNYEMFFEDKKNDIEIHIKYQANVSPHWIAQEITNGNIPMGLGFYKYGFIPKCEISGKMIIKDQTFTIKGIGYFEHVWGNLSFENPFAIVPKLGTTVSTYAKLFGWWIHNHSLKIPKTLTFSSENNPFGYDWVWAVLDNGWSLFYGNSLFWFAQGPAAGILYLLTDDKNYKKFCNIYFKYNKTRYMKKYDFNYPSELELTAINGKEKLHLIFSMEGDSREYVSSFTKKGYWAGLVICEAPGNVTGYYFDGDSKIPLNGMCKIEPQRQIPNLGHNSLKLDFLLPPKGVGFSVNIDSHYLRKKMDFNLQIKPKLKLNFHSKNQQELYK
jgi:hypothetical protein